MKVTEQALHVINSLSGKPIELFAEITAILPELNHAVCIRNRNEEIKRTGVYSAFCTKGALPQN